MKLPQPKPKADWEWTERPRRGPYATGPPGRRGSCRS